MRKRFQLNGTLVIVVMATASGCMSPWSPGRSASGSVSVVKDNNSVFHGGHPASTVPTGPHEPNAGKGPQTNDEAMAAVLDELQQIGAVDHAAQQKLMADLHEAKPEDWPQMVKQFQSALAFREQLAAKESKNTTEPASWPKVARASGDSVYASKNNHARQKNDAIQSASAMAAIHRDQGFQKVISAMAGDAMPSRDAFSEQTAFAQTKPLPPPPNTPLHHQPTVLAAASLAPGEQPMAEQVGHVTPVEVPVTSLGGSQEYLQAAIASMEQSTQDPPASVDDIQNQMRLRLLRLLAGQENAAASPIPGASRPQQDYWSNQIFALSTYLNNKQQPDVKRRAAGSLMHLDSARSSLAELATLNVRNLTFVKSKSVGGFGVYQELEETKFRPGDQVTLYTEVENFRSQSTKEGFNTQLSTSYEVLDLKGIRVDGAQFPDVKDLCKNQRRDFHMQYGVALPTHIYAGHYHLQLTITDQLSHKIGQSSVPFEIVE